MNPDVSMESLLIAASGIAIVFLVLAVLCFLIPVISGVVQALTKKKEPKERPREEQAAPQSIGAVELVSDRLSTPSAYGGDVVLIGVDEKTAACVMAIVSYETGIPLSELVFRKIKEL